MVDWKKDISLRPRRRDGGEAERPEPATESHAPEQAAERTPFWKKELKLGRGAAQQPAPAAEPATPPQISGADALARALAAVDAYAASPLPTVDGVASPVPPPAPPAAGDGYGWLTAEIDADTEARSWTELDADSLAPPPAPQPAAHAVPPPVVPAPPAVPAPTPVPAPPAARPAPPPAPPGIHPPVPAAELPALPSDAPAKTSFLRRELSFGRKRADGAESKPKRERAPKRAATAPREQGEHVPFWKRDLSLGRKEKAATVEAPQAVAPGEASAPADAAPPRKQQPKPRRARGEKGGSRHKRVVGLKIGASQLAAAEVINNGSAQVVKLARVPLAQGVVVGGELREPDALADSLKTFFAKNKLPKRNVRLGIATNRIGVRSFDLEGIEDPKQLANAIRFRAQEALPIPIEDAVLDYHVIGEVPSEEGPPVRKVLLVVAYRELIERYVEACRKAGIKLVGIDLEAFALLRALGAPREETDEPVEGATVVVSIGYDRSTFAVSDGRVCEFTRVLDWGGFSVDVAVARALDLSPSEAEPFKRQLSAHAAELPEGLSEQQVEAAREAMRKQITTFARELVSSLQFYQGQPGSLSIGGITITGGTSHLDGLAEELERLIGVPVAVGDPLARVRVGKKVRTSAPVGSLAVAIGLGIED